MDIYMIETNASTWIREIMNFNDVVGFIQLKEH
jgi:hypothetical protein